MMGKTWLVVMLFLRILILLFAGYPLYQDDQEHFVCNTMQPGCANVCYDLFSPISLFRFWLVQLITLCIPLILFIIYVVHKVTHGLGMELNSHNKATGLFSLQQLNKNFTGAYFLHLLFRTLLEAGFGVAHYYLFGFYIPRRFLCQHPPCITQVDCYISRPTEKTVMLNFMLGMGALSIFLNVLDFFCTVKRSMRHKTKQKLMVEKIYEEEQCFISAGGASKGKDQNVAEIEHGQTGSFRKRRGSKGSTRGATLDQEPPKSEHPSLPQPSGGPGSNTNGNNGYCAPQEEVLERQGSDIALCPAEPLGTPRSIRVSKRSRLKPPPPPRRDLPAGLPTPVLDVSAVTAMCTKRVGQDTLVELSSGTELQLSDDGQEKRAEWV